MNNDKETKLALQPGDSIDAFRALCGAIANNFQQAGAMLQRLVAADPGTIEQLSSGPDAYPESFLNGLLRVAERQMRPELFLIRAPAYRRLQLMPYTVQSKLLDQGTVEIAVGEGPRDIMRVDLIKLEGEQLKQAIGPAGLRSLDEQRAWRRREAAKVVRAVPKDVGPPYEVKRDRLKIHRGNFELSRIELLRLLEQMVAA